MILDPHLRSSIHSGGATVQLRNSAPAQQRHRATAPPRNSATAQQRHCATAPLRNSATAQQRHFATEPLRNRATAQKRHCAKAPPRRSLTAQLNNATTLQGSFILALSLSSPPFPFCKAQQQRNRSLILDPHLRSSIHSALRNSVTAQQRHCASATIAQQILDPRSSSSILDPQRTAQQRHCAIAPLRHRATARLLSAIGATPWGRKVDLRRARREAG